MISSVLFAFASLSSLALGPQDLALEGQVVDSARQPVAGARLFLAGRVPGTQSGEVEVMGQALPGADGRFTVEIGAGWLERGDAYKPIWVAAHAEGHGLFAAEWSPENVPAGGMVTLGLPKLETFEVRVVDGEGAPVEGALVGVTTVAPKGSRHVQVPEEFWRALGRTTDGDGRATLPVGRDGIHAVTVWTEGRPGQSFQRDQSNREPLTPELRLDLGRVVPVEAGDLDTAGLSILVRGFDFYDNALGLKIQRRTWGRVSLAEACENGLWIPNGYGSLIVAGGDPRALVLEAMRRDKEGAEMTYREAFGEGAPSTESVVVRRAATLFTFRGSVEDDVGQPLAGFELRLGGLGGGTVRSREDGTFEAQSWRNQLQLGESIGTADWAAAWGPFGPRAKASPDSGVGQFDPIRVCPLWAFTGRVVDGQGEPLGNAYIVGKQSVVTDRGGIRDHTFTGVSAADGTFALRGARTEFPMAISVVCGRQSATVTVREGQGLAVIELAPSLLAVGRIKFSPSGLPAAGTALTLDLEPEVGKGGARLMSGGGATVFAAEDGTFRFDSALDPERRYTLNFHGPGILPGRSASMTGAEWAKGMDVEVQALRRLAGRLLDSGSEPIVGAKVGLRSSGLAMDMWTEVGADGGFLVGGGAPGEDLVIAQTPDGEWHAKRVGAAAQDVEWTLTEARGGEAYGAASSAPEAAAEVRERAIAAELAASELELHLGAGDMDRALSAMGRLSWSDPMEVLRRVDEGLFGGSYRRGLAELYVAEALTKSSPRESLAVSQRAAPDMFRVLRVLAAARGLPRAEELECLALERANLRAIPEPEYRLVALAKIAERLVQIGRTDAAVPLLEEGKAIASQLATADWAGYARASFGEVLALVDSAAGLAMIESMEGDGDPNRHFGNVAHKLAAIDPPAAEEWVKRCAAAPGSFTVKRFISRVAYHMAVPDAERALRLAEKHDSTGFSHGMIALALAGIPGRESEAAVALELAMERATLMSRDPRQSQTGALTAAALIPVAAAVDPERIGSWAARALAVGLTIDPTRGDAERSRQRLNAALGFYAAPLDVDIARALVEPALAIAVPVNGRMPRELRIVWAAYALIDPKDAAERAKDMGAYAMGVVADVLGRRGAERAYYVQTELLNLWAPGKEDL